MRVLRLVVWFVLVIALLAVGALTFLLHRHPDFLAGNAVNSVPTTPIRALFLGTSSMAWTDGKSTWLVDGFFSRQPIVEVMLSRLSVDENQVKAVATEMFKRLNMPPVLGGIVVAHSHYDHSIDAPFLAKQYGGRVLGSQSTLQIALGQGLSDTQTQLVPPGSKVNLGEFQVEMRQSAHAPTGFTGGFNRSPLSLPAHALAFKEGISYSFVVSHPLKGDKPFALIQPSAGLVADQNKGLLVDVVFLGTGGLGKLSDDYVARYWQEMVLNTQAKTVYLIHWDDFTWPLLNDGKPLKLKPMPRALDDFPRSLQLLTMFSQRDGIELKVVDAWQMVYF